MDENLKEDNDKGLQDHLANAGTWLRLLFMILFGLILYVVVWVIFVTGFVQFLYKLFSGESHPRLKCLGRSLGAFGAEISDFLAFRTEDRPYPWGDWPSVDLKTEEPTSSKPASAPKKTARTGQRGGRRSRSTGKSDKTQ